MNIDILFARLPNVEQDVGVLVEDPVEAGLADVGIVHAVPGLVGGPHVAIVVARVAGAALVLQDSVQLEDYRWTLMEEKLVG